MRHSDFIKEYATTDIYCGSLYTGGKADIEAMAAGCVVYSVWPQYDEQWTEDGFRRRSRVAAGFSSRFYQRHPEIWLRALSAHSRGALFFQLGQQQPQ